MNAAYLETQPMDSEAYRGRLLQFLSAFVDGGCLDLHEAEAVAEGVSAYCREKIGHALVPDTLCVLLLSRALHACGYRDTSKELTEQWLSEDVMPELATGVGYGQDALLCWKMAVQDAVRTRHLDTQQDPTWVLNLEALSWGKANSLELALQSVVDQLIAWLAPVWDRYAGRGVIAFTGLRKQAASILGRDPGHHGVRRLKEEIHQHLTERLVQLAQKRQWNTVPYIVDLDLRDAA